MTSWNYSSEAPGSPSPLFWRRYFRTCDQLRQPEWRGLSHSLRGLYLEPGMNGQGQRTRNPAVPCGCARLTSYPHRALPARAGKEVQFALHIGMELILSSPPYPNRGRFFDSDPVDYEFCRRNQQIMRERR